MNNQGCISLKNIEKVEKNIGIPEIHCKYYSREETSNEQTSSESPDQINRQSIVKPEWKLNKGIVFPPI